VPSTAACLTTAGDDQLNQENSSDEDEDSCLDNNQYRLLRVLLPNMELAQVLVKPDIRAFC
jgi:hypothetical protein